MTKRERIIQIVGFNTEPERAELIADEIIALFEQYDDIILPHGHGFSMRVPYNKDQNKITPLKTQNHDKPNN